jgi:hypothetical protein
MYLRPADHSSRGVLPIMVCLSVVCILKKNFKSAAQSSGHAKFSAQSSSRSAQLLKKLEGTLVDCLRQKY